MKKLITYAKELGAKSISKVNGPNGAFISMVMSDDSKMRLPVGKRSQAGKLDEYNILIADGGQAIATINSYETAETITL